MLLVGPTGDEVAGRLVHRGVDDVGHVREMRLGGRHAGVAVEEVERQIVGARRRQRRGATRQAEHLVTRRGEAGRGRMADDARSACDQNRPNVFHLPELASSKSDHATAGMMSSAIHWL